ncbi:MAG: hypothetical protein JJD92_03470 [Frankiaceae bacterium]|nr:hypothetical protein [Frankiaceae bacterium]
MSGELARREQVGELVSQLSDADLDRGERGRLLVRLAALLGSGARLAGARAAVSGRWLVEAVADVAPHVPVRDLLTLRQHHGGLSGDDLAEALVSAAARTTAGIGAAGGALAAAEFAAPPTLLAAPVQLAAETVAVVSVELKLVAELHVVYGRAPVGTRSQVATAYLMSWATKRGIDATAGGPSLASVLGTAARAAAQPGAAPARPQRDDDGAVPGRGGGRGRAEPAPDPLAGRHAEGGSAQRPLICHRPS